MNEHLKNALIFLGLLLATFGTLNIAKTNLLLKLNLLDFFLFWVCWLAIFIFCAMEILEVILMWKDIRRERLMQKIRLLIAQSQ